MSNDDTRSAPVNLNELHERVVLQAELMGHDERLRNFTPLRDRLMASGQDANAKYREIMSRRDQVITELKKLTPALGSPPATEVSFPPLGRSSFLTRPLASARFDLAFHNPWFGYSGSVQMGRAREGADWLPSWEGSPNGPTGSIETTELGDHGEIRYAGDLVAGILHGRDNSDRQHVWEHNWHILIPFPAPVVASIFTYTVDVFVLVATSIIHGFSSFWSYIYAGETADFVGQEVVANTEVGWPLVVIDNFDGNGENKLTVQRSFFVEACHVPAVALTLGVMTGLEMEAEVRFNPAGACWVLPGSYSGGAVGDGVVHFRYDPVPPQLHP